MLTKRKVYEFKVAMKCAGCGNHIKKVLDNLKGSGVIDSEVDLVNQKVRVTSTMENEQKILEALKATGKPVQFLRVVNL